MSKSIIEQAVETLNKYRNQNYNSTNKDEVELANAINVILPKYVKQEMLLELYRKLITVKDELISVAWFDEDYDFIRKPEANLEKRIKELQK